VAVLRDGLLQQCDTPRVLYDRPANSFVAGFIGSPAMNLKTVPLTEGGAKVGEITVPLSRAVLDDASRANLSEVTLGVRPESFQVITDGPGVPLHVDLVEELGADAYVYGTTEIHGEQDQFVVRVADRAVPQMGETIKLLIVADETHVFHPEAGNRLGD
jgi:multiple sugar transport system ATP-binding protein